jgi:SAM-dependent methyltransferase
MWDDLSQWWSAEVASDPAYAEEVIPLLVGLLGPGAGEEILDAGIGEGQVARVVSGSGANVTGVDLSLALATAAGSSVVGSIRHLEFFRDESFDAAYVCLVLEHLETLGLVFAELKRVTKPGGRLVLVINHPVATAPESGPVMDPVDGELFWRPGRYLASGFTEEPAGGGVVRFYHRPFSSLLNAAADAGFALRRVEERGVSSRQIARDPGYAGHEHHVKLLGCLWEG